MKPFWLLAFAMIVLGACSGGSDDDVGADVSAPTSQVESNQGSDESPDASGEQPGEASSEGATSEATPVGPVGLVLVTPATESGLLAIDAASGASVALATPESVENVDLNNDVVLVGDSAFTLGSQLRDGQSSARDVSIVRVDLATGTASTLAAVGPTQETDDDPRTDFTLLAATGDLVIVRSSSFATGGFEYMVYDASTGALVSTYGEPRFEAQFDSGSCSGDISEISGFDDGRFLGVSVGSPAALDTATGTIEPLVGCDEELGKLGDFVDAAELDAYAITGDGSAPGANADSFLSLELEPSGGLVAGGGDLWWISIGSPVVNDAFNLVGALVQFDLGSNQIEAVHALGEDLGTLTDCGPGGECFIASSELSQLRYLDDQLIIVGVNDNDRVLVVDPATGAVSPTTISLDGAAATSTRLLAGSRDDIWLEVRRFGEFEDGSRQGTTFIERLDVASGEVTLSIPGNELSG